MISMILEIGSEGSENLENREEGRGFKFIFWDDLVVQTAVNEAGNYCSFPAEQI